MAQVTRLAKRLDTGTVYMAEARPYKDATNQFAALGPTSLLSQYMPCGTRACVTTS